MNSIRSELNKKYGKLWAVWVLLPFVVAAAWLGSLSGHLVPASFQTWGMIVEQTASSNGEARFYFNAGKGMEQDLSVSRPVLVGKRSKWFFPLPHAAQVEAFRFDPIDRSEAGQSVVLHRFELVGPMRFWSGDRPKLTVKPGLDAELTGNLEDGEVKVGFTGVDPQVRVSLKPKPVSLPEVVFGKAAAVSRLLLILPAILLVLALLRFERVQSLLCWLVGAGWVAYLFAYFVWQSPSIPSWVFYHLLLMPTVLLALLDLPSWVTPRRSLLCHPPMWVLAAFVVFFGTKALWIGPESVPSRGAVLSALGALLVLPAAFLFLLQKVPLSGPAVRRGLVILAALVATWIVIWLYGWNGRPLTTRLQQGELNLRTPLLRAISGTAVFGMILVLAMAWVAEKKRAVIWVVVSCVAVLPLMSYVLLSQSRSVVFGLFAVFAVLSVMRGAWLVRGLSIFYVVMMLLTSEGMAKRLEGAGGRATAAPLEVEERVLVSPASEEAVVVEAEPAKKAEGKSSGGRVAIWRAYLEKIPDHLLLGHGFAGKHKLYVELDESLFKEGDGALAKAEWNPHSLHLSVLYFGGIVGLLLHLGLLGTIFVFGFLRYRDSGSVWDLLASAWVTLAGAATCFESTLMAYDKEPVLLYHPNEYWIFYWGAVVYGIIRTLKTREEAGEAVTT